MGMNEPGDELIPIPDDLIDELSGKVKDLERLAEHDIYTPVFEVGEELVLRGVTWRVAEIEPKRLVLEPLHR